MNHGRCSLCLTALLLLGACSPAQVVQPARPEQLKGGILAFLSDGVSTRAEVLLALGPPVAQYEGERILSYAFRADGQGAWHRVERRETRDGRPAYLPGTSSLILVFDGNGVLARHSLTVSE